MNDSCCKTIVGGLFASYFLRQFDQDLHKLAYLRGNVHRKIRSQHGDIYCLALMFGSGLRSVTKPHRNLKVYAWKETAFRLAQVSSGLPTEGGTLRWNSRYLGKYYALEIYHAQERPDAPFCRYFEVLTK